MKTQMHKKTYIGMGLLVLVIILVLQNITNVDLQILFWKLSTPKALLIFLVLVIGAIIGWIAANHFHKK